MSDILVELWKTYLGPVVGPFLSSVFVWQGLALTLLTLVVVAFATRKWLALRVLGASARGREHDATLFKKLDAAAPETLIGALLNQEIYSRSFRRESIFTLLHFLDDMARTENQYLNPILRRDATDLRGKLRKVERFVSQHFFSIGTGEDALLRFHPDRIEPERYDAYAEQLNGLLDDAWVAYEKYRAAVKTELQL